LEASFLEVYNETIRDLLRKDDGSQPPVHTIIHDEEWGLLVTNVTAVEVDSMQQIRSLMDVAGAKRAVGDTDMNSESSRSHAVFALYLKGVNLEIGTELCGALHLVDLAGSERLDKSGATGGRLKETQSINKSLSSLADVFIAKAEGRNHVPFRNSKLTYLMEPCLSGQGKTLMMVNVGPEELHAHESLCSLRFAKQVSQCHTGGKPKRAAKMATGSASSSRPPTPTNSRPPTPTSSRGLRY
jgi:kinesin family protein C1